VQPEGLCFFSFHFALFSSQTAKLDLNTIFSCFSRASNGSGEINKLSCRRFMDMLGGKWASNCIEDIFLAFDPGRTGKIGWKEFLKGLAYGTLEGMELSGHFKLESRAAAYTRLLEFRKQDVEIYQLTEKYTQENEEMSHQVNFIAKSTVIHLLTFRWLAGPGLEQVAGAAVGR
jgi:hypothetical protein